MMSGESASGRRRTIAYLFSNFVIGGTERHAIELLKRLDRRRFAPWIFCIKAEGPLLQEARDLGLPLVDLDIGPTLYALRSLRRIAKFASFLRRERVDILHTYLAECNIVGALARLMAGRRTFVASQRNMWSFIDPNKRLASKIAYRIADWIHANSCDYKDSIQEVMRVPDDKFVVIRNGIDPARFRGSAGDEMELRRELRLDAGERVVGMVAMMNSAVKGHDLFLRAARNILRALPQTRFLLIGDGERRPVIEALCRELGLESRVSVLGERTDVPRLLSVMDVFVQCQPYTGTNAVIEAMAAGRPVVMTSSGRDNETVDGEDGYIVAPGDDRQLAGRTIELLCDTERAKRFGLSGRRRVETNFSIAAMVKKFEDFYASV